MVWQVLHRAPALAGRLYRTADGVQSIDCNNAGAQFTTEHLKDVDLESFVPNLPTADSCFAPSPALAKLLPCRRRFAKQQQQQPEERDTLRWQWQQQHLQPQHLQQQHGQQLCSSAQPLLAVKHTHLEGGGSALATCFSQACCDPAAVSLILERWAEAYTNLVEVGNFANSSTVTPGRDPPDSSSDRQPEFPISSDVLGPIAQKRLQQLKAEGRQVAPPQLPVLQQGPAATSHGRGNAAHASADSINGHPHSSGADTAPSAAGLGTSPSDTTGQLVWHVSAERVAQLKKQANEQLSALQPRSTVAGASDHHSCGVGGSDNGVCSSSGQPVSWVSSYDAVTARLHQVLASLPGRASRPLPLWLCVDLRQRLQGVPDECMGNVGCPVLVAAADGSGASDAHALGAGAAQVRAAVARAADEAANVLAAALQQPCAHDSSAGCSGACGSASQVVPFALPSTRGGTPSSSECLLVVPWDVCQSKLSFGTGNAAAWFHAGCWSGASGACAVATFLPAVPAAVAAGSAAPWDAPDADGLYVYLCAGQQELQELQRRHPYL